jgi:hypothetical protein
MSANDALEQAVLAWRTKHQVREDDPILAVLDLVRVYLAHAPPLPARDEAELPPSYAEFRETVEMLDRRANSFATQSLDLIIELRRAVDRGAVKREPKTAALLLVATLAACVGFLLGRMMQSHQPNLKLAVFSLRSASLRRSRFARSDGGRSRRWSSSPA